MLEWSVRPSEAHYVDGDCCAVSYSQYGPDFGILQQCIYKKYYVMCTKNLVVSPKLNAVGMHNIMHTSTNQNSAGVQLYCGTTSTMISQLIGYNIWYTVHV